MRIARALAARGIGVLRFDFTGLGQSAGAIFQAARHPKSFVSLDTADHLLTKAEDAEYAATMIAAWVTRFVPVIDPTSR